jgi:hypothetical protein
MWRQAVWFTPQTFACSPLCYCLLFGFVKIGHMVQKFNCYRQTNKDTQQHGDVKICIYFPESQSLHCLCYRTVCVFPPAAWLTRYMTSYFWKPPNTARFSSLPLITTTWRTREFVKQKQHKPHLLEVNQLMFMGLGISCIVYCDVCLR